MVSISISISCSGAFSSSSSSSSSSPSSSSPSSGLSAGPCSVLAAESGRKIRPQVNYAWEKRRYIIMMEQSYLCCHYRPLPVDKSVLSSETGRSGPLSPQFLALRLSEDDLEVVVIHSHPLSCPAKSSLSKGGKMWVEDYAKLPPLSQSDLPLPALLWGCVALAHTTQFWAQAAVYCHGLHRCSGHQWCLPPHLLHQKASLYGRCLPERMHDWKWPEEAVSAARDLQRELQLWVLI